MKAIGAVYLVFLGVQALRASKGGDPTTPASVQRGRPFWTGLATNLLNPKVAVFYSALLPGFAPPSSGAWGMATLVLIHACLTMGWLCGYAHALHRARGFFEKPRVRRSLDRFSGVVLLGFAIRLATERS